MLLQPVAPYTFRRPRIRKGCLDVLVEGEVIVGLKSVETLAPVHSKQRLTYLRLMNLPVGLLINFDSATLKEGLKRIVNQYQPSSSVSPRLRVNPFPAANGGIETFPDTQL